jgi:hypothetical protein
MPQQLASMPQQMASSASTPSAANAAAPGARPAQAADGVLVSRLAATLAHHEPGWMLPRPTILARRYDVPIEQVSAAIDELAARQLVRRLADGQACRTSPAQYLLQLAGQPGLRTRVEPVRGQLCCKSRTVAWHSVRTDIGWALGIAAGEQACILRLLWTADGDPAALSTSYLAERLARPLLPAMEQSEPQALRTILPLPAAAAADDLGTGRLELRALHIEMQLPPPWAAKALRLSACEQATVVTVSYGDPARDPAAGALTVAVLRADLLRVAVESAAMPLARAAAGCRSQAWQHAADECDC